MGYSITNWALHNPLKTKKKKVNITETEEFVKEIRHKLKLKVSMANPEKQYCCSNPECKKTFDKPKLIKYYACPHCMTKIEEKENEKEECQHFFGYLNQRDKNEPIPQNCIGCEKVLECMLNKNYSQTAVEEIKKWY